MKSGVRVFLSVSITLLLFAFHPNGDSRTIRIQSKDTSISAIFDELRIKTEKLFEAKKDSFSYEGNNSVEGNNGYIYSIVKVGNLFNKYDRHALIAYSLDAHTLYVEVRQLIGKVWVKRFRNTSGTKDLESTADPVTLEDLNGDGIPEIFIAKELALPAHLIRGDVWAMTKDGVQKWTGFDQIENPGYDPKEKQIVGHFIAGMGLSMSFGSYELNKNHEIIPVKSVFCDCTLAKGDSCLVTIDKEKPRKVLHSQVYKYVPAYFSKEVQKAVSGGKQ
jgi:hypothetical protein